MTSLTTRELQQLDSAHYLHPFTDHKALAAKGSRVITRAEGCYIYTSEGDRILDGMSGLWCVALGYGRKELSDAAYKQMLELPYYNSFFQSSTPPAIELARLLKEVTPPQFNHVFYTGSGSEANDTLVRLVRRYWQVLGQPERNVIVSRWNGYHGSTVAGAA
jgi:putrescine---pyruvate transaminase